jgi:plasmid stabilization system protein ParE
MKVAWTPLAEARAAEIVASMRADRSGAAWRWLQAMLARIRGVSHAYQARGARGRIAEVFFAPCRIVYIVESERLVIVTLRPAGRHRKSARYEEPPRGALRAAHGRS